jgi:murein DD-endopeptidase MepM/ murein hydrolase activator NlpD
MAENDDEQADLLERGAAWLAVQRSEELEPVAATPDGPMSYGTPLQVAAGNLNDQIEANQNWKAPKKQQLDNGKYAFLTAPERLKRIFESPLVQSGEWATGPGGVRRISAGWGAQDASGRPHTGLSYPGGYGEAVLACGGGTIEFVGYFDRKGNPISLPGANTDLDGDVYDADNQLVVRKADVGAGGIAVRMRHDGDFHGYRTEYFHLSGVAVAVDDSSIVDSQLIGYVGLSGNSKIPTLYVTVSWSNGGSATLVVPTNIVPNYSPSHPDSTDATDAQLQINYIPPGPGERTLIEMTNATAAGSINRADALGNQTREDVVAAQTKHNERVVQTLGQQQQQSFDAAAKDQASGLVIIDAMTYDFSTGLWMLGDVANGHV